MVSIEMSNGSKVSTTFGIGNIVAAVMAWHFTGSIWWTIWDCLWGWLYVIIALFKYVI